jgi:hypothetical protein
MRPIALALLALATAAGTAAAQDVQGRKDRVFTLTEKLADGAAVRIFSSMGDIAITEGSGATLSFRGEKEGDVEDFGYVVLRGQGGITICVVRSDDDDCTSEGLHQNRRWSDRDNWRWRDRNKLTITVQVPRGTHLRTSSGNGRVSVSAAVADLRIASGNGRIDVSGVQGPVTASSGNGDVSVTTTSGPDNASSGNGRIRVEMDKLPGKEDITLSTGNGRIELIAPADFSADVDATTGNGSVTTDFPIQLIGRLSPHRLRGTIGDGARRLRMSSGNGALEIRKKMS